MKVPSRSKANLPTEARSARPYNAKRVAQGSQGSSRHEQEPVGDAKEMQDSHLLESGRKKGTAHLRSADRSDQVGSLPSKDHGSTARVKRSVDIGNLVEEHGDYLFQYAMRYTSRRDLAEDLVQETFISAMKGLDSFRGDSSAKTWLVSILRHKLIDSMRQNSRRKTESLDQLRSTDGNVKQLFGDFSTNHATYGDHWLASVAPGDWKSTGESVLMQKEFVAKVQGCLAKLPERLRSIFLLREVECMPQEEIARTLDLSTANVRVILHRSRLLLRECLDQNWFKSTSPLKS